MSLVPGVDLDDFLETNKHNIDQARIVLRPYLGFFQTLSGVQHDLLKSVPFKDFEPNPSEVARYKYLAGLSVNLTKAVTNVFAGHFSDANIFSRKTIESVRYSIYLREFPERAHEWRDTLDAEGQAKFSRLYKKWLKSDGGTGLKKIEAEFPVSKDLWSKLNNFGPHSNFVLMEFQSFFESSGNYHRFRTQFHEVTPGDTGTAMLIQCYFIHTLVHFMALDWWIYHSKLAHQLSSDQRAYLKESRSDFEKSWANLDPYLTKHLAQL